MSPSVFPRRQSTLPLLALTILALLCGPVLAAKNVIILVADGAGYNTFHATSMYQGKLGKQVYDGEEWVKLACTTYPLSHSYYPNGSDKQDPRLVYDFRKAWDKTDDDSDDDTTPGFMGYSYLTGTAADSAAAATALATGVKTYNSSINWTASCSALHDRTIPEIAKSKQKAVGVVTSVPWSHATPAGLGGAHNCTRNDYRGIANEMLNAPYLDVIMGAGHPEFTDDATPRLTNRDYQYVGGPYTWERLKSATHPAGWKLIQSKAEFEALGQNPAPPAKVLGIARVASTLQQKRGQAPPPPPGSAPRLPFAKRPNTNVPSLETMTAAAVNSLSRNPKGFYLMIEGGAVDWANHAGQPDRMIEEQVDFLKALEWVVNWVETKSNWRDTLVIVTADHECGMVWGPDSDKVAFDKIVDHGAGKIPGMRHLSGGHTNSLVPLLARGAGSEQFYRSIVSTDSTAAAVWGGTGQYVDNTSVFTVAKAAILGKPRSAKPKTKAVNKTKAAKAPAGK